MTETPVSVFDCDHQPQGTQPEDERIHGMRGFFDRYAQFVRVAKARGVSSDKDRIALFAIYYNRME